MFTTVKEVKLFIYSSYVNRYKMILKGSDKFTKNPQLKKALGYTIDETTYHKADILKRYKKLIVQNKVNMLTELYAMKAVKLEFFYFTII